MTLANSPEPLPPTALAGSSSRPINWRRIASTSVNTGDRGDILGVDKFGASAPAEDVFRDYGFTVANVIKKAKNLLTA